MKTGFLAGCALSSHNPGAVSKTALYLKERIENFAVMQQCCGKPTKLIGQQELFSERYNRFSECIQNAGIGRLIVACPGCMNTIKEKGSPFEIVSLWEFMAENGLPDEVLGKARSYTAAVSIHDSCATRDNRKLQDAIRIILNEMGYKITECEAKHENARCCGFGGMVGASNSPIAKKNAQLCVRGHSQNKIVTYCASCSSAMNFGGGQAWHILDLIWGDVLEDGSIPKNPLSNPAKAWLNRYRTKRLIKNI